MSYNLARDPCVGVN